MRSISLYTASAFTIEPNRGIFYKVMKRGINIEDRQDWIILIDGQ